jgi:hypothetical protein
LSGWSSSLISTLWLIACRRGRRKILVLKDIYLENRFIHNKLEAILFEEMRRIDLLCVTTSLGLSQLTTGATIIPNKPRHLPNFIEKT